MVNGPHNPTATGAALTLDTSICAREPIHIPGAIQPQGALLATLLDGGMVTHASANLAAILGLPPEAVLGQPLEAAIGAAACRNLREAALQAGPGLGAVQGLPGPDGRMLHLHAHPSGRHLCLDIEPLVTKTGQSLPITMVQAVLATFRKAAGPGELCELAVRGLKAMTGYDRVLAYRFGEDGHGEVVAEAREPQLEPYLGLRYPASDVPPQARRQYLLQPVGSVADAAYQPVPLLGDPMLDNGAPLDLTYSTLRSISPFHRQYMRNMGTAASLTIGLAHGTELWGMLVCHHMTPRVAGPELRAVAGMIGQVVSLLLVSLAEAEVYARRIHEAATLRSVIERLAAPVPLPEAMATAEPELLRLIGATGALVRLSGQCFRLGRTPPQEAAERALAALEGEAAGEVLAVDDLGLRHPALAAACTSEGSGALLLPLAPKGEDAILWFRPELSRTVTWGGNPAEHAIIRPDSGQLSPRASFAAWQEIQRGRSAPWEDSDFALARELRSAVEAEMAQRTRAELARLRHYDPLTGLPNRALLQERLTEIESEAAGSTALLFLDLDRFKAINDTLGHAAGDALLVEVAERLRTAAGPANFAARLGGDEFVVLCRGQDRDTVGETGDRIRQAIEAPFEIDGRPCRVTASIGIAFAGEAAGHDLVRAADMAMYVAKQCGGNRGMRFDPSLYERASRQFELDHDLRQALATDDQFVLFFQPVFEVADGARRLAGFEALLRWRHPRQGWLTPSLFLPLAEGSGLMPALGDWVLARALRQGCLLLQARREPVLLAVNLSAGQLTQPGFATNLAGALQAEGFPPTALCVEVTEAMLADVAVSFALTEVRKLGVRVALADFGMGYSSLSNLCRLPVDLVKLDRSFLDDVGGHARGAGFFAAVVALIHAAGLKVVLEGVETEAQLEVAAKAGADLVQGFLLGAPVSVTAAAALAARLGAPGS